MQWVSSQQMVHDVAEFAAVIPDNIVGVVGIPRSGSMVGSLIAMYRHLYFASVDSFVRHGFDSPGKRLRTQPPPDRGRLLLLDDSIAKGRSMKAAHRQLQESTQSKSFRIIRACLYAKPGAEAGVDLVQKIVPMPRVFQWNLFAHPDSQQWAFDLDGVFCVDPKVRDNDGPTYRKSLRRAAPLWRPRKPIGGIITCRLQRWNKITKVWLGQHQIKTKRLIMHPAATARQRRKQGRYGEWKAEQCQKIKAQLMVESNPAQASVIAEHASIPVICTDNMQLYQRNQ